MPRKETITKGMVLDAAISIAKKEGLEGLTARSIAKKLKCSTIPIYSQFRSMGDLEEEVLVTASSFLLEYAKKPYSPHPFLNMGIGMVLFSRDNPKLFNALFSGRGKAKQIVGGVRTEFRKGLIEAEDFKRFPSEHVEEMLDLTMVFTMGLAGMASSGLLDDVTEGHIISMLDEAGDAVINHSIRKALGMDASAGAVFREYQMLEGHSKKGGKAK